MERDLEEVPGTRCSQEDLLALVDFDDEQRATLASHGSLELSLGFDAGRVRRRSRSVRAC
ncbi:MAG: hypothetical protein P8R42_25270 [Candidatus Binatia bacterium]|nr:hypothetical protein [Candidatus Binatia bacterium]